VGESGSRTTAFTGPAVVAAAEDVRRQIFNLAADQLKVKAEELDHRSAGISTQRILLVYARAARFVTR
jgi:CO/xanthine dehydrogenase Mo-binding subunit